MRLHRDEARTGQLPDRARQRPRHSRRSASQIQKSQRAGGNPHDPPFGRQVWRQGLRDLGRAARRRQFGGERAVGNARSRGRARARDMAAELREGQAGGEAGQCRPREEPARHSIRFKPDPKIFRPRSSALPGSTGFAAPRPISSAASRSAGTATPRCSGMLATRRRPRRCCIFRAGCATAWRPRSAKRHARSPSFGPARPTCLHRRRRAPGAWNGRSPGWRAGTGSFTRIATRSRPLRAARMRPGSALRWSKASAHGASIVATGAPPR